MDRKQADTFMKKKANRDLWVMEATGVMGGKPYKSKYINGKLYVWWTENDDEGEVYDVKNIHGESEHWFDTKDYDDLETMVSLLKVDFRGAWENKGGM